MQTRLKKLFSVSYFTGNPATINSQNRTRSFLLYTSFSLLFFGCKLWVIYAYGNATPYWDQWDGEARNLYKPFVDGTLGWNHLLAPHNEHRIFTTRLLALLLLKINILWNPLLQMVVNAALHVFTILIATSLLTTVTGRKYLPAILFFSLILFAIPFGWENTLSGFQTEFYLVLLFSLLALWCLVTQTPFSRKWWMGIIWSVLAFLSFASGIFAIGAAAGINLIYYVTKLRKTYKQLMAVALLGALFIAGIWLTPTISYHAVYKVHSLDELYNSLRSVLGWPFSKNLIAAFFCNVPALIFIISLLRKQPPVNDPKWFLATVIIWSLAQCASIAYGRASMNRSPRYLDTYTMGILANFVCVLVIAQSQSNKWKAWAIKGALGWTAVLLICLGLRAGKLLPAELAAKRTCSILQETSTRNYLATGDTNHFKNKEPFQLPYPDPNSLATLLSVPEIKNILPGNINLLQAVSIENMPAGTFVSKGYTLTTTPRTDSTLGSFHTGVHGNEATGTLFVQFNASQPCQVQFAVTGYPLSDNMKLEIEQNGQPIPVNLKNNPEELWKTVYATVNKGPFSLRLTDSSTIAWMAISMPSVAGRMDRLVEGALSHYYIFVILGLTVLAVVVINSTLTKNELKPLS